MIGIAGKKVKSGTFLPGVATAQESVGNWCPSRSSLSIGPRIGCSASEAAWLFVCVAAAIIKVFTHHIHPPGIQGQILQRIGLPSTIS